MKYSSPRPSTESVIDTLSRLDVYQCSIKLLDQLSQVSDDSDCFNSQDRCTSNAFFTDKKNHIHFMLNPNGCHRFNFLLPLKTTWKMSKDNLQRLLYKSQKTICSLYYLARALDA